MVDALFSLSATAPTMPSGYDRKRRIGSIARAGGSINAFVQFGDMFTFKTPVRDVIVSDPGTSAVLRTLSTPSGIVTTAFGTVSIYHTEAGATIVYLSSPSQADVAASYENLTLLAATSLNYGYAPFQVSTDTSARIRSRINTSSAARSLRIDTWGWIDTRGRG